MKVLYTAPYRDGTGYSHAAIANMLSLDTAGVDVVARQVKMTATNGEVPQKIGEFEQKNTSGIDAVIQHNLPSEFVYKSGVKNIGVFSYETDNINNTGWRFNLGLMDKVIVSCKQQKDAIGYSDASIYQKTCIVPFPVDVNTNVPVMDFGLPKNCTKFYTISEFNRRKNLHSLLCAYFTSFTSNDNVVLVIKTSVASRNQQESSQVIKQLIDGIKGGLNRFFDKSKYPKIILFTNYMTEDQIRSLHKSCDIYVTTSCGESFCLPAIHALGYGHPVIAPANTAFMDYVANDSKLGNVVDGHKSMVFGINQQSSLLYTSDESWFNVDVLEFANTMKRYYQKDETVEDMIYRQKYVLQNFSYEKVGKELLDVIK